MIGSACGGNELGTWDSGPFDNDTVADWCGDLHDAQPSKRPELIRNALLAVADERGFLESPNAEEAIAAAAIVAAHLPSGEPVTSPYAPDFLLAGERLDLPGDLAPLAVRALDRVMDEESEWRELWEDGFDASGGTVAFEMIRRLRAVLSGSSG